MKHSNTLILERAQMAGRPFRDSLFAAIAAAIVAGAALLAGGDYLSSIIILIAVNILITAAFRFVLLIGELNFATAGFVGIGAYASAVATTYFELPFAVSLLVAILLSGAGSLVFGYVTLRAKGPYFLLISFAFTEVLRLICTQVDALGGNSGLVNIFPPEWMTAYYSAVVVLAALAGLMLLFFLERSAFGKILAAIRNNDNLVQTLGINVHLIKVCCVGVASALAGLAGALQAHANNVISPGDFSFLVAAFALAYLKIGGESHIMGSVLGATLLTLLAQFAMRFGPYEHIFYGAAIVIAVLLMPGGLIGVFEHFRARNHTSGRAHARVGA